MSGIKGRSGRKSMRDEEKRLRIIDKAWDLVFEKLQSHDQRRFMIAKDIVLKDITTKLEGTGFANQYYLLKVEKYGEEVKTARRSMDSIPEQEPL